MAQADDGVPNSPPEEEEKSGWGKAGKVALGLGSLYAGKRLGDRANYGTENAPPTGYQGDIPDYSLVREQVLDTYNPDRVAGSRGQRYFSDFAFLPRAYAEGTETGGVTVSRNEDIDAVRQAMFDQANVGPDSLRAANYARVGGIAPELPEGAGPTGIDSVLGYPEERLGEYTQKETSAEDFDITDPTQYQAFAGGNVYVPNYGVVNVYDETAVANFLFWKQTGEGAPGMGEGEGDPGEGDPGEGDPAESFASRGEWGEQATPGSYTQDIWPNNTGLWIGKDAEGNLFTAATEQEAMDIIRESTPPSVNDGQNFSTKGEWKAQAIPGSYTQDIWSQQGGWLVVNAAGNPSRVATEEEAILAAAGSGEGFKGMNYEYAHPEIQRRMDQFGMTYAQAEAHNASTLKQAEGFDANNDGYISFEEWAAYQASLGGTTPDDSPDDPVDDSNPDPDDYNQGGLISLMGGGYLSGSTDGMADDIYTTIDNTQPAALSDGEFVIPADVVSHLGNGNSDAGANELYTMLDKVRMDRTGTTKQGKQINPDKYMPRGIA